MYSTELLGKAGIGDRIRVSAGSRKYEGILMPQRNPGFLVVKLDNGYNIGLKMSGIKIELIEHNKPLPRKIEKPKHDPSKPNITIIHTGGTIASRIDYRTGAVASLKTPEEILSAVPQLQEMANIDVRIAFQMFSEDMEPAHWMELAKIIHGEITERRPSGIIVTHGTDTMAFTSAALSFMLRDLPIPVILTGSQRSSDRGSSDAFMNLLCACRFAAHADFSGVGVCMHGTSSDDFCLVHQGTSVKKMHTSRRDTFASIDASPVARIDADGKIEFMRACQPRSDMMPALDNFFDMNIAMVRVYPGFDPSILDSLKKKRGIVIEGSGLGHAPINVLDEYTEHHSTILSKISQLSKDALVVMVSQCPYGRVNMNVYSTGRDLQEAGVIPAFMTAEAAYAKLGWVLGHSKTLQEAGEKFQTDVCGETKERIEL